MKKYILCAFNLLIFLFSCNNNNSIKNSSMNPKDFENSKSVPQNTKVLDPKSYMAWVRDGDNGLKRDKTVGEITFSIQYKPLEYIVCLEEKKDKIAESLVQQKVSELSDMQYFDLSISLNEGRRELLKYQLSSPQQYNERVNYFAFAMQKDIVLVQGDDTLPCVLYHFERAYDVTPSSTFLLGFSLNRHAHFEDKTLILYDKTFDKGTIKIAFDKDEFTKIPRLKTY